MATSTAEVDTGSKVKEIQEEAKRTFSLRDRLAGIKQATRTVVVYTDPAAAEQWTELDRQRTNLESLMGADQLTAENRAEMQTALDGLTETLAEARTQMLEGAFSVHMRAVPQVVLSAAMRETRKRFADPVTKEIAEERTEQADEYRSRYLLGRVIQRIGTADGDLEFDRETVAQDLEEALPIPQWRRIMENYGELVFSDAIGTAATDDPGF